MQEVAGYWEGPASEEYQRRMFILRDFGDESAESMRQAEEQDIPALVGFLSDAQQQARDQDLYPTSTIKSYEQWLEETPLRADRVHVVVPAPSTVGRTNERACCGKLIVQCTLFDLRQNQGQRADPAERELARRHGIESVVVVMQSQTNLLYVVAALHPPSRFAGLLDSGQEQRDKDADNGDYHQ
jgi:hypothetical protein